MRVARSLGELTSPLPSPVVTVGNFDGVHRGHQRILETVVKEARQRRGTAVAVTFEPQPSKLLRPEAAPALLTTLEQKLALLEAAGLDLAVVVPFTREFSQLSPRAFADEVLRRGLGATVVCVGESFRFGQRQAGDVALLAELAREVGFELRVVAPVVFRRQTASSSLVRQLIQKGEVARAGRLLARPYALTGSVAPGAGRGRTLDFPTLNFLPEQECLPARGVYATETVVDGRAFPSATNVGVRPTFGGEQLVVESHLLDFRETLTAGRLEVRFHERLRAERKFPSAEVLREQIAEDVERTRRFFDRRRQLVARRPRGVTAAD